MKRPAIVNTYSGLNRAIYVLFLADIVNSMGNFVFPFLTMFLTQKLGIGEAETGMYIFIGALSFIPGSLLGGKLADHWGRKKVLIVFQGLAALCLLPCAFWATAGLIPWLLILSTFFLGAGRPVIAAMIADLAGADRRKAAFSLIYLGHNIGFAVGPLIAGFLFNHYTEWIFLGDAGTSGISLLLIFLLVPESKPSRERLEKSHGEEGNLERAEKGSLLQVLFRRPFLLAFLMNNILLVFVYAQNQFSLPLYLTDIFGQGGPENYGLLMSANALVVIFLTTPVIHLTNRGKPILSVSLASALYALGFGMIFFIRTTPLFFLSTVIWTIGEILAATNAGVYVANHTPLSHRGRVNSLLFLIRGAGHALGSATMGPFIQRYSAQMVWPVMFVVATLGSLILITLYFLEKRNRGNKSPDIVS